MKNKFIPIVLLACSFTVASCGGGSSSSTSTPTPSHTHSYDTDNIVWAWSSSSLGFAATATLTCKTCESSVEGHTLVLDAEVSPFNEIEPTCTESGLKKYKAEIVYEGKTYYNVNPEYSKILDPLGHKIEYTHDEEKHYHLCSRCGYVELEAFHDYSEWEIVVSPDYGVEGLKKHHCLDEHCGYEEEAPVPALIPSVAEVQAAVDKANGTICPLTAHMIKRAKMMYDLLSEEDKKLVKNYENLEKQAKLYDENYGIASELNPSELVFTEGWNTITSLEVTEDKIYGKVLNIDVSSQGGVAEYKFEKLDTTYFTTVTFYVYSEEATTFTLSKEDWWRNAYDFSDKSWKTSGDNVKFSLSKGWNEFTMSVNDFSEALYFSAFFPAGQSVLKITPFYGKKTPTSDVEETIALIKEIKNDDTKIDAYRINKAEEKYNTLSTHAKTLVTNYDDLVAAKAKALYCVGSALNPSELVFTEGWETTTSVEAVEDQTYGHILKINVNSKGGVAEFMFKRLDVTDCLSVTFSVYSESEVKFTVSKGQWWKDAYDFSDGKWKDIGNNVNFTLSKGWNELTMSPEVFKEISYFSAYFPQGKFELTVTPFYGKKLSQKAIDNVVSLIDMIPADVSTLQMKDTYEIAVAKKAFDALHPLEQAKVTNVQHLDDAIANSKYSMASFCNSSSLVMTTGWSTDANATDKIDSTKGHVSSFVITANKGALEYKFIKENIPSDASTVSFSVYVPNPTKFTLSKEDWWRNAYDFSDGTWKNIGSDVNFVLSQGWNDLSIPLKDFTETSYFSFSMNGVSIGDEIMVSAFYAKIGE